MVNQCLAFMLVVVMLFRIYSVVSAVTWDGDVLGMTYGVDVVVLVMPLWGLIADVSVG